MSKECSQSCPLVEICQYKIDSFQTQADSWAELGVQANADTDFWIGVVTQGEVPPEGVTSLTARRHQNSLEAIAQRNAKRSTDYEVYRQQFQDKADSARTALQAIQEQCSGRFKLQAKIGRLFGRITCGTTCDTIPTSGSRLAPKKVALGLYDQGFYQGPTL